MEKNTNAIIIGLLVLIIGFGAGYVARGSQGSDRDGHMMSDGRMMGGSDMDDAMGSMMAGLQGKTGDEFDKAFLAEMIVHHQGAVQMAQQALTNAKHQEIKDLSASIISAQNKEIGEMQNWQKNWYAQ